MKDKNEDFGSDLILKNDCKRVVIACEDPYEKVAGKSIQKLKDIISKFEKRSNGDE